MAKVIVSDGFGFDPGIFEEFVGSTPMGDVVKHENDLWRVSFEGEGEIFVRGDNFHYNNDDQLKSGDITSFSLNAAGSVGDAGPALVRIRDLDDLSGAQVHDAIKSGDREDYNSVLRSAFKGDDVMKGANEHDVLVGLDGADKIDGNGRGDELLGGHGADRLDGGGGADDLDGGKGKDSLFGGGDSETGDGKTDTFAFDNGDSGKDVDHADRVHDFVSGTDVIDLSQTGADPAEIHFNSDQGNTNIVIDAHDGEDKMVIVVVGNDHVSISDVLLSL